MPSRYNSLVRYSHWDGSQKAELEADDILSAISEDLMEFGDLQQAMRYLMQRGMDTADGNYIKGLRDLLRQLKDQRRQRLERFDMGGIMEDIKKQLDEILDMERETIDEWIDQNSLTDDSQKFMDELMQGLDDSLQTDRPTEKSNCILIRLMARNNVKLTSDQRLIAVSKVCLGLIFNRSATLVTIIPAKRPGR